MRLRTTCDRGKLRSKLLAIACGSWASCPVSLIDRSCGRPRIRPATEMADHSICGTSTPVQHSGAGRCGLDGEADRAAINVAAMPSSSDIFSEISPLVIASSTGVPASPTSTKSAASPRPTDSPLHHTPPGST